MSVRGKSRLPPSNVQKTLNCLKFDPVWTSDPQLSIRLRDYIWQAAQLIAETAVSQPKKTLGFSTRRLKRLERKLRSAARDYGALASHIDGLTLHGEHSINGFADEIRYLLAAKVKPKQRAKMNPETEQIVKLIQVVESCTGKRHLQNLAYILYDAYDQHGISRPKLSAETLDAILRRDMKHTLQN